MKRIRRATPSLGEEIQKHSNGKTHKEEYEGNTELMVSTGSTLLDLAISGGRKRGGGLPGGIMVVAYGPSGCVDCDTEFLSPEGWVKISKWNGEKVMQYYLDGTSNFVVPDEYTKNTAKTLYHLKTKYGINQCLSLGHKVLYYLRKKKTWHTKSFGEIIKQHQATKYGFTGTFETIFTPLIETSVPLTNEELRVQVMFVADGSYSKRDNAGRLNLKKERKIKRAEQLLTNAKIKYKKWHMSNGFSVFSFHPPLKDKYFDKKYYQCSLEQLRIITDEIFYWDAGFGKLTFFTTIEETKDFIQYALASCGFRNSVYTDSREGRKDCYTVIATKQHFVGFGNGANEKVAITEYTTTDGFEYCFSVPSGYLVLRRCHNIFITGNSGKSVLACEVAGSIQRQGGKVNYKDSEARLDKKFSEVFDLKYDKINYEKPNTIPEAFLPLYKWKVDSTKINGYIIDSLAALSTNMEMDDDSGDKMGMRRAKEFSEHLRKGARIVTNNNLLLFCTNQIREKADAQKFERKDINPGGKAIEFYASLILRFSSFKKIVKEVKIEGKIVKRVIGIDITIEVVKSSIWKPYHEANVIIYFDYGIYDLMANLRFIKEYTKHNVYTINGESLDISIDKSVKIIEATNREKELREQVINLWEDIEKKFETNRKKKERF